jgi:hypothetical protein
METLEKMADALENQFDSPSPQYEEDYHTSPVPVTPPSSPCSPKPQQLLPPPSPQPDIDDNRRSCCC